MKFILPFLTLVIIEIHGNTQIKSRLSPIGVLELPTENNTIWEYSFSDSKYRNSEHVFYQGNRTITTSDNLFFTEDIYYQSSVFGDTVTEGSSHYSFPRIASEEDSIYVLNSTSQYPFTNIKGLNSLLLFQKAVITDTITKFFDDGSGLRSFVIGQFTPTDSVGKVHAVWECGVGLIYLYYELNLEENYAPTTGREYHYLVLEEFNGSRYDFYSVYETLEESFPTSINNHLLPKQSAKKNSVMYMNNSIEINSSLSGHISLSIFNLNGRRLYSTGLRISSGINSIRIPNLFSGICLIKIDGVFCETKKIKF